jgi:hypothetical protein
VAVLTQGRARSTRPDSARSFFRRTPFCRRRRRLAENPANPGRPDLAADIEAALAAADLRLEDGQVFDAPEVISEPEDLYRCLTFMRFEPDTPSWDAARPHLQHLLASHGPIDLRQRRFLWTAVVD